MMAKPLLIEAQMQPLNLPPFPIKTRLQGAQPQVFDSIRRRYVPLTPEEWVRQHFVHYLAAHKGFPLGLMAVEHPVLVNGLQRRVDIVAFDRQGQPLLVVECKAPEVRLTSSVFAQAARYNLTLRVPYLLVTNGLKHFCSRVDLEEGSHSPIHELPDYQSIG